MLSVLVLLALGMWVGGRHPDWLPKPVRSAVLGDSDTAVVREAIDKVNRTYYRKIPKDQLADDAIAGIVSKLNDRFSNYFNPAEYKRFRQAQSSEFSGVGLQVSLSKSSWNAPVSNDKVTITYKQAIGQNEPLRTGSYSKSVTFTLSTTNP